MTIIGFMFAIYSCEKSTVIEEDTIEERIEISAEVRDATDCKGAGEQTKKVPSKGLTFPIRIKNGDYDTALKALGFSEGEKGFCTGNCDKDQKCKVTKLTGGAKSDVVVANSLPKRFKLKNDYTPPKDSLNIVFTPICKCK